MNKHQWFAHSSNTLIYYYALNFIVMISWNSPSISRTKKVRISKIYFIITFSSRKNIEVSPVTVSKSHHFLLKLLLTVPTLSIKSSYIFNKLTYLHLVIFSHQKLITLFCSNIACKFNVNNNLYCFWIHLFLIQFKEYIKIPVKLIKVVFLWKF